MGFSNGNEVIDLTRDDSDIGEIPRPKSRTKDGDVKRDQRKRRASASLEEGEIASSGASRAPSPRSKARRENGTSNGYSTPRDLGGESLKKRKKKTKSAPSSRNSPHPIGPSNPETGVTGDASLFFVDLAPSRPAGEQSIPNAPPPPLPNASSSSAPASSSDSKAPSPPSLLLPAHVSLLSEGANGLDIEIIRPPSPNSDSDSSYIEYLDIDGQTTGQVRYFHDQSEDKKSRAFCKKCGAEGEHVTRDCPVLICLTCGARDEHGTLSCPISRTCFNCGMKGHMSRQCPNARAGTYHDGCDRCGSSRHRANECPTLWRIYEYVSDTERNSILEARDALRQLQLGEGGEAYVARDVWCYNCGGCGHLGDDCQDVDRADYQPGDPSAFGVYNTRSGPFYDTNPDFNPEVREPREWEAGGDLPDGWGFQAPTNVGKQARSKERKRMAERARQADEEGEDDWFDNPGGSIRIRGMAKASSQPPKTAGVTNKLKIQLAGSSNSRAKLPLPRPATLADRIDVGGGQSSDRRREYTGSFRQREDGHASRRRDRDDRHEREWDRGKRRVDFDRDYQERDRAPDSKRDRSRSSGGPRYHGGYAH